MNIEMNETLQAYYQHFGKYNHIGLIGAGTGIAPCY